MIIGRKDMTIIKKAIGIIYASGFGIIPPKKYPESKTKETQTIPPKIL